MPFVKAVWHRTKQEKFAIVSFVVYDEKGRKEDNLNAELFRK